MELQHVPRTGDMTDAHLDPLVVEAVQAFLEVPSQQMLTLLKVSLYGNHYPGPRALSAVVNSANLPTEHHESAYRMAGAAMRIGAQHDHLRSFRFGAVLEQLVTGLLRRRSSRVLEEIAVGPMPRWWGFDKCEPIDQVVDDPSIEFVECKCDATDIEGIHLTRFRVVFDLATEDGRAPCVAFATLSLTSTIVSYLAELDPAERPIFAATLNDLTRLATERPQQQVA